MQQRHKPAVKRHRFLITLLFRQAEQRLPFTREGVRHSGDPAFRPNGNALDHHIIQPSEQHKAVANGVAQVDKTAGIAGGVFEADDVVAVGQGGENVRRHVVFVNRRVVVHHDRQVGSRSHTAEVGRCFMRF